MSSEATVTGYEIAPVLSQQSEGKEICCVGTPVCLDPINNRHCLATVPQGERFYFEGFLEPTKASFTLLRVKVGPKSNVPLVTCGDSTHVLGHDSCTWQGARQILELCSGLGAMGQGALASGFGVIAACDFRKKMCELYQKHSSADIIHGDICTMETLLRIAGVFPASGVVASGISCQPYSFLGDGKSGQDPRSSTLPATLILSYLLRAMVIVIECVGPAQTDPFVNHHINNFCSKTRFLRSDCLLELQDVWPSRRSRWWCILSAPAIGKIEVGACKDFGDLKMVEQVLPCIRQWPRGEEEELRLTPVELEAFRDSDRQNGKHLLNKKGQMPCALHCWGSQLTACPCGCRSRGLSEHRLQSKGLFGVLVESTDLHVVRHLHPQEAAALCGLDPALHWGSEARLALGAVGQLASPLQAIWIFAHVLKVLQVVQWQSTTVDPKLMLMAYRAWLLARCRFLLRDKATFPVTETLAVSERFDSVRALPMSKLLPAFVDHGRDITIQTVWEAYGMPCVHVHPNSVESEVVDVKEDLNASEGPTTTPVPSETEADESSFVQGLSVSQVAIDDLEISQEVSHDPFDIILTSSDGPPTPVRVSSHSTIRNLQHAETHLHGVKRKACRVFEDDVEITHANSVLKPGSIYFREFVAASVIHPEDAPCPELIQELSKQALQPIPEVENASVRSPTEHVSGVDSLEDQPLARLVGSNFLKIHPPVIGALDQATNLLAQRCDVPVRIKALDNQGEVWADDEVRWHLLRIQNQVGLKDKLLSIDPILMHGAISSLDFKAIGQFLSQFPLSGSVLVSVVHQEQHWYPVHIHCKQSGVQVTTWDVPEAKHTGLDLFCKWFADFVGLPLHPIHQIERRFSGQKLCGALSLGFLEHKVCGTVLPETSLIAESHHRHLRQLFRDALIEASTSWQPWLWGNGVNEVSAEHAVQTLTPMLIAHGVPSDHAHHRAQQAVKAIGVSQVMQAIGGKAPWKSLKTLGNNVKFRFITEEERQAQIATRAGQGQVGKPRHKSKPTLEVKQQDVALDPMKLGLPEGAFSGGGKPLSQIPLSMVGPLAEGVVVVTWQQAEPYLRSSQVVAKGSLALLVLQGPVGGCNTSLQTSTVTVPARCIANQEPILLEAVLVQLGSVTVSKTIAQDPMSIESVQVSTIKLTVFRDECQVGWDQFCSAPMKYILQQLPLLRLCRSSGCSCPCWHNSEAINVSDAIVDVWRRQFLRAGYKPEPPSTATIFSVCLRVPSCLLGRLLTSSSEGGIYVEPRSMDSKEAHRDYEVVWIPKSHKAALSHLRQTNPAAIGIVRIGDRFGLRVKAHQAADLHKTVRPDAVYLATGVRQQYLVGPIPYGTDRKALCKALLQMPWEVKTLATHCCVGWTKGSDVECCCSFRTPGEHHQHEPW